MTTDRQTRLLDYIRRVGGVTAMANLPRTGEKTLRSLAEHGYIEVTVRLTDKGYDRAEGKLV